MVAKKSAENPRPRKHVLTDSEAFALLSESSQYFSTSHRVGDRHMAEVMAEGMAQCGELQLASSVLDLHDALTSFQSGRFAEAAYFGDAPVFGNMRYAAKGTGYEGSIDVLEKGLSDFTRILMGCGEKGIKIDWKKSAEVLAAVKRDRFPGDLTMVEKLDHWQRDQSGGRHR